MRAALEEARRGLGFTSPNPAVGAVLVRRNSIISTGHHRQAGSPHAEIECLRKMGSGGPADATLYVTLEPCSTTGRTQPCTNAILSAGVRNVVVGAADPNPAHAGRGIELLREAGVDVRAGVLENECTALNEAWNKWIRTRMPFVIAKCGMSLDGRLTTPLGENQWITSAAARRRARKSRATVDAILIGAETLRADNPRLTVRGSRDAKQPWRVVLTRSDRLPRDAHLFSDRFADRTLVYRNRSLTQVLQDLGKKDVTSVLLEGGGQILGEAFDSQLIDKVNIYIGAIFTGGPVVALGGKGAPSTAEAARLESVSYEQIGRDVFIVGYPKFSS